MSVFCKKKFNDEGDLSRMTKDDHNDDNDKNQLKNKNLILRKTRAECARSKKKYIDNTMIVKRKTNILKLIISGISRLSLAILLQKQSVKSIVYENEFLL